MTAVEIATASGWLAVVVGAAASVGSIAARANGGDRLDRWFTGYFAAVAEVLTACVVLACLGAYSRWWVFALQVAAGAAAVFAHRRLLRAASDTPTDEATAGTAHAVLGMAAAFLVLAVGVALAGGPSQHFESKHYHFAGVANLVTTHNLWDLPFQNPAFFTANHPQNGELLSGVLAMATGGDELIYLPALPLFALLTVLAAAVIARAAGSSAWLGALAALAVLSTPLVFGTQARSIATDLPAAALVVAALAFLVRARERWTSPLLAGVALGAALGTKYTVLIPVAFVAVIALVRLGWRRSAWMLPGLVVLGAPWFVRNWIATGNPLYPQRLRLAGRVIFQGGETPLTPLSNTVASLAADRDAEAMRLWANFVGDFYGPVAVIALLGAVVAIVVRRREDVDGAGRLVGGLGIVAAVAYAITPYTGAGRPPLPFLMGSNLRYAIPAIVVGVVAAALVAGRWAGGVLLAAALGWAVWQLSAHPIRTDVDISPALLASAALVAVAVPLVAFVRRPRIRLPQGIGSLVVAATVTAVGTALVLAGPLGDVEASPLEREIAQVANHGPVVVVGVDDLRSVIGTGFARVPRALTPGEIFESEPFATPAALARALDEQAHDVAVVGVDEHPGVPDGFEPSADWCPVADVRGVTVYERGAGPCE